MPTLHRSTAGPYISPGVPCRQSAQLPTHCLDVPGMLQHAGSMLQVINPLLQCADRSSLQSVHLDDLGSHILRRPAHGLQRVPNSLLRQPKVCARA